MTAHGSDSKTNAHSAREVFSISPDDRYDRLKLIGWWDQSRLSQAKVLVVGAGALGNEVLKNLALVGVGQILVLDLDVIETSNLSRSVLFRPQHEGLGKAQVAAEMASQLNSDCRIVGWQGNVITDVGLGLVHEADLVICCVDNREARLWINRLCWKVGTPWIDGGIQEINGVAKVFIPGQGACYECAMTENDYRLIQLRYSCPLLSRDDIQEGKVPTAPTIASIIGGLQVQEALKLLHRKATAGGTALVFNGDGNQFYRTRFPVRSDCLSHEHYDPIIRSSRSSQVSVDDLLTELKSNGIPRAQSIELDRDFLVSLECRACHVVHRRDQLGFRTTVRSSLCTTCQHPMQPRFIHQVELGSERGGMTLSELGVPANDIVKIRDDQSVQYLWLEGDRFECGNRIWS